jgi:F0F1-type ATP synthase membrane subunit c/vacuolar-type H+-ATPase subunit K
MCVRKGLSRDIIAAGLSAGLAAVSLSTAEAANVVVYPGADFSTTPYTITFGSGMDHATYTFSYIPDNDAVTVDQVSSGGDGLVSSFLSHPPQPVPYQLGILIGSGDTFTGFPSPAPILYSASLDSIGLEFRLSDGFHFGYVTTFGPELLQYGYNPAPGAEIATGSGVPEPSTWAMLIIGLGALGAAALARKNVMRRVPA